MGHDIFPASVYNDTGFWMVVKEDDGPFRWVPTGYSSSDHIRSIDALGVMMFGVFQDVVYNGRVAPFWKVGDGTSCWVSMDTSAAGAFFVLNTSFYFPYHGPQPSLAK